MLAQQQLQSSSMSAIARCHAQIFVGVVVYTAEYYLSTYCHKHMHLLTRFYIVPSCAHEHKGLSIWSPIGACDQQVWSIRTCDLQHSRPILTDSYIAKISYRLFCHFQLFHNTDNLPQMPKFRDLAIFMKTDRQNRSLYPLHMHMG